MAKEILVKGSIVWFIYQLDPKFELKAFVALEVAE